MKKILIAAVLLKTTAAYSQSEKKEGDVNSIFKITVLNPGLSYEQRIGRLQTLYLQAFIHTSASVTTNYSSVKEIHYFFDPALTLQYRYYYNYNRRSNKGLRTSMNNLNYVASLYQVFFSKVPFAGYIWPIDKRPVHAVGVLWGLQRNYNKARFGIDLNVGPALLFSNTPYYYTSNEKRTVHQEQFALYSQLNIGFWLNKQSE